jgi:hypothetical protein
MTAECLWCTYWLCLNCHEVVTSLRSKRLNSSKRYEETIPLAQEVRQSVNDVFEMRIEQRAYLSRVERGENHEQEKQKKNEHH